MNKCKNINVFLFLCDEKGFYNQHYWRDELCFCLDFILRVFYQKQILFWRGFLQDIICCYVIQSCLRVIIFFFLKKGFSVSAPCWLTCLVTKTFISTEYILWNIFLSAFVTGASMRGLLAVIFILSLFYGTKSKILKHRCRVLKSPRWSRSQAWLEIVMRHLAGFWVCICSFLSLSIFSQHSTNFIKHYHSTHMSRVFKHVVCCCDLESLKVLMS